MKLVADHWLVPSSPVFFHTVELSYDRFFKGGTVYQKVWDYFTLNTAENRIPAMPLRHYLAREHICYAQAFGAEACWTLAGLNSPL